MKNIYPTPKVLNRLILILTLVFSGLVVNSQNIAITDDDGYNADASAMLDIKSLTKGLLVPRLTTAQRDAISSPATGLLVYDTDNSAFFYFDGSDWLTISQSTSGTGRALFAVLNANSDTVFAVYEDGVRVIVPIGAKGKVGGFAVSGRSPSKAGSDVEYLRVTPDSTRITFEEGAKGKVGGFAVSGRSPSKAGTTTSLINLFPDNYFIGDSAGINTTGLYNTFFGYKSGKENITGARNVFMGYHAGMSNETASYNVLIGNETGEKIVDGRGNVLIGYQAAKNDVSSNYNSIIGYQAGLNNTGDYNAFYGYRSGNTNTGDYNSFFGPYAGYTNEGTGNAFFGERSGYRNEGNYNVFLGYHSGYYNTTGANNVFIGNWSGYNNDEGQNNVIIGFQAGRYNYDASGNVFIGYKSGWYNAYGASTAEQGSYNTFLGYESGYNNRTGLKNTALGYQSGHSLTSGSSNVFIGNLSGYNLNDGDYNVFVGDSAAYGGEGAAYNVVIGQSAGKNLDDGQYNTLIGYEAGYSITSSYTTAIGYKAGRSLDSWQAGTYIGHEAGIFNTGRTNVFVGAGAGRGFTSGQDNVCVGKGAGGSYDDPIVAAEGARNVFLGWYTGYNCGSSASDNVIVGAQGFTGDITGSENVLLGSYAGNKLGSSTGSVMIGHNAGYNETGSDKLYIANTSTTTPLIYGDFSANTLKINGDFEVTGNVTGDLTLYAPTGYVNLTLNGAATTGTENRILFQENGTTKTWVGYQTTSDYFYIYEGGKNSFVSKGGNIGINTVDPSCQFDITGTQNSALISQSSASHLFIHLTKTSEAAGTGPGIGFSCSSNTSNIGAKIVHIRSGSQSTGDLAFYTKNVGTVGDYTTEKMRILANGNVGIGTTTPGTKLAIVGLTGTTSGSYLRIYNDNVYYYSSSRETKEDIKPLSEDFSKILKAQPVSFRDKASGEYNIGYIAEDFDEIGLKNLVVYENGKPKSLSYELVSLYNLEVIKGQKDQLTKQQQQIDKQQKQINTLIKELKELKK